MQRRVFIKVLVGAAAAPKLLLAQAAKSAPALPLAAPVPWTLGLTKATPVLKTEVADTIAQSDLVFFSPAQMATLEHFSDLLVPALGGRPGALQAGVPAFLDFFISSSPADRRQMYQEGLDWLDAEATKRYSMPFSKLKAQQADTILQPWMRSWMTDHPPVEAPAAFVNIAHADIRTATVNSKVWSDAPQSRSQGGTPVELYWSPIDPDLCREGPAGLCAKFRNTPAHS